MLCYWKVPCPQDNVSRLSLTPEGSCRQRRAVPGGGGSPPCLLSADAVTLQSLSLPHSLTHSFIHSLIHSFFHSFTRSLTHSLTHSVARSLTRSFTGSLIHSLVHSLIHSLVHALPCGLPEPPGPGPQGWDTSVEASGVASSSGSGAQIPRGAHGARVDRGWSRSRASVASAP